MSDQPLQAAVTFGPEQSGDAAAVEALIDRAFGPGRFAKTAERLRETAAPILSLSFVARAGAQLVGCVRLWPIAIGETPALLLGPFAVEAAWRRQGVGLVLINRACEAAARAGHRLVLLVGDEAYYASVGFEAALARSVTLPGPVDRRRVLVRALVAGAAEGLSGVVSARALEPGASPP